MARKSKVAELVLDDAPVAVESADSPVDHLPAAQGKKRRGRPRKARAAVVPAQQPDEAGNSPPARPPAPEHTRHMSRGQIHGAIKSMLEKQFDLAGGRQAKAAVRAEVKATQATALDPGVAAVVHVQRALDQQEVAAADSIGSKRGGRWRHMLV